MASTLVERPFELNQLFMDISSKFSPAESEYVVKSSKRIYGEQFKSLGNQDLLSCLDRLCKFGYISSKKLTLIKEFIATRSNNEHDINKSVEDFETSHPSQPEPEKELHGRIEEFKEITEKLKMKPFVVNLYGSAGVGKTTLARNICDKWAGEKYVFDLREAKDMTAVYRNIMGKLDLNIQNVRFDMGTVVGRIHDLLNVTSKGPPVLLLLDNVDQFTEGKGKEGKNLRAQFLYFLGKLSEFDGEKGSLNVLLTSRTQLNNSENVSDFKLQPLTNNFSAKVLLPTEAFHVETQQKKKLLDICKGVPLLLKGISAILKQRRKSPSDLIDEIEMNSKEEARIPVKSKYEEDTEERPFNPEEEGIDDDQISVIREMFYSLPSDTLRVSAVSVSLFHGPFSASTAAKILGVSTSEAVAQLEGLVTNEIIHVVDEDAKQLMYDIHPLLRKYAENIQNDDMFYDSYTEAKGRFYEHFMSKMKQIAGLIESSYIRASNEFRRDRPNFEFAIDIALLPEYFSVPGGYHENALIVSLFNAMLSGKKQAELFHSWAEMCKDDGNLGSLFCAQLRCWEARLVLEAQGAHKAFKVLQKASLSLKQVDDKSTESFKLTQGLYLYFEGEIYYQNRDYHKAIECLESSLDLMEGPLKLDTNVARCYNALGNCYYGLDRPEKALEFYNKALKMREELSGSDYHYDMPVYKNQIGTVHEHKGEYEEAVKCYKDALELLEKLKSLGYEDEALFRRNLANVYVRRKEYIEAEKESKKAFNIRIKFLGNHPDTVRSIFQLGVIQANLQAYEKALNFFLEAWKMEKLLGAGNHSAVWRLIIKGVFDMCYFLKKEHSDKIVDKEEEFRRDALVFCQYFWKEEKASLQFSFTAYNKEIIDAILHLLDNTKKEERALVDQYTKEALWFYDGSIEATEEYFYKEFETATDDKMLNAMLRERTAVLDGLFALCARHGDLEKLLKHKKEKMTLFKKVLVRSDFVGENKQEKANLRSVVEELYEDLGEKRSIKKFQKNLLATWQRQWEEGKGTEESRQKLVSRRRLINGILQLCKELGMKDLHTRYQKEDMSFRERLWELQYHEMRKLFLNKMEDLASSIGDRERENVYLAALQDLREKTQLRVFLERKEIEFLLEKPSSDAYEESEETEDEDEEDFLGVAVEAIELEDVEVASAEVTEQPTGERSQVRINRRSGKDFEAVVVIKDTVTNQGAHWNLKQVKAHVIFPPDAVSEERTVTVRRWDSSVCSPPLNNNEALVSDILELSTDSAQCLDFNKAVTLVISHCVGDLQGIEIVAKKLVDRNRNEWDDISETADMRSLADISKLKDPSLASDIPDYFLPVAEFEITQCSTFAVVSRLKSHKFTATSEGKVLSLPDHPLFNAFIPHDAVQEDKELHIKEHTNYGALKYFTTRPLRITTCVDEWGSSKGGLSTLNRELSKHLALLPDVVVTLLLPHYSEEEKQEANNFNVCLATPEAEAEDLDIVIGHGHKLGPSAQVIAKQCKCKRVHVVHTSSDELAMFKVSETAIQQGEKKRRAEVDLCEEADIVVAIGPKLKEDISAKLRYRKDKCVIGITPGIFQEFAKMEQASEEGGRFRILVFGRGDSEDFELKGYDIAAKAVASLKDKRFLLLFVGAPKGKEEEVKNKLLKCGIPRTQLIVRGFVESREEVKQLLCEVDLAIMPSRTEGFGLTALEALSAGLPILVSNNSGFSQAIRKVEFASSSVVCSDDPEEWGKAIRRVSQKPRKLRLEEAYYLREYYDKEYNWEKQCKMLVDKMREIL